MSSVSPSDDRVLRAFRRAAADMPWYRTLLDEHGVRVDQVDDRASFSSRCPVLTKGNTFDRFSPDELAAMTPIADVAAVLTSSGHGGRFSFGLSRRSHGAAAACFTDSALDAPFLVKTRPTLAINCLPMGVGISSECMTVATTSVREDMALALVRAFGPSYRQLLIVADPLFMKRLTDAASVQAIDWSRHVVQVVLGEETFGEHFRAYLAACLGHDLASPERGHILSSFGVGELGLHLCYETPVTVAVRRAAWLSQDLARDLLGTGGSGKAMPMIFAYDPLRTFIEIADPDGRGYGLLTVSMLDTELPLPLLRYQTGDVARLLDGPTVALELGRHGVLLSGALPPVLLALEGRASDTLPDGTHVGAYKDALYADHAIARQLTGAFRVVASGSTCSMHVQSTSSEPSTVGLEERLLQAIARDVRPARLVVWPYDRFPFGMTVDYERKFAYYVPGERDLAGAL